MYGTISADIQHDASEQKFPSDENLEICHWKEKEEYCLCPAELFTVASRAIGVHFNIPHQATGFMSPAL